MLDHELRFDEEILLLNPREPLEAADFVSLTGLVDAYLAQHGTLRGVLIHAQSFPGWNDFGALLAHLKFVKDHHQNIEKVAVVADGALANVMPGIAGHFIHAEVRHFDYSRMDAARAWLGQSRFVRSAA